MESKGHVITLPKNRHGASSSPTKALESRSQSVSQPPSQVVLITPSTTYPDCRVYNARIEKQPLVTFELAYNFIISKFIWSISTLRRCPTFFIHTSHQTTADSKEALPRMPHRPLFTVERTDLKAHFHLPTVRRSADIPPELRSVQRATHVSAVRWAAIGLYPCQVSREGTGRNGLFNAFLDATFKA